MDPKVWREMGLTDSEYKKIQESAYLEEVQNYPMDTLNMPDDYNEVLLKLLASPNIASKEYAYRQENAVCPTPTIGMVGLVEDLDKVCTQSFKQEGDAIFLIGENLPELGGSEYLKVQFKLETGKPPALHLDLEKKVQDFVLQEIQSGLIKSAHDCSEGGLAVALAESCITGGIGADITLVRKFRGDALLFGETQSRIIISIDSNRGVELVKKLVDAGVPYTQMGKTGGEALIINVVNPGCTGCGGNLVNLPVTRLEEAWRGAIPCLMK